MKKPKLALKYFIRLIELQELVNRRTHFHRLYSGELTVESLKLVIHKYDADNEVAVWESRAIGYPQSGKIVEDFGRVICDEVTSKTLKVKAVVLEKLSLREDIERGLFYRHIMTDIERLTNLVSKEQVFARYPCIEAALLDIKEFTLTYAPKLPETGLVDASDPMKERVVGCHYKYIKEGSRTEDKALTSRFLGDLFHKLRDELGLISPDTSVEDFRAIFSGRIVQKPVMWIGTNKQLRRVIKSIEPKLMPLGNDKIGKWVTVAACFIHRDGKNFTADQLQNTGPEGKHVPKMNEIRELVSVLR